MANDALSATCFTIAAPTTGPCSRSSFATVSTGSCEHYFRRREPTEPRPCRPFPSKSPRERRSQKGERQTKCAIAAQGHVRYSHRQETATVRCCGEKEPQIKARIRI